MTVQVVTQLLREAADAAADLAGQTGEIRLAAGAEDVADALPGSSSAAAAGTLASGWRTRVRTLARDVDTYALDLSGAADDYDGTDQGTASTMGGLQP